jgi:hypothetical protein
MLIPVSALFAPKPEMDSHQGMSHTSCRDTERLDYKSSYYKGQKKGDNQPFKRIGYFNSPCVSDCFMLLLFCLTHKVETSSRIMFIKKTKNKGKQKSPLCI